MALYVNTNVSSLNAQRQLMGSGNSLDQAFERLSSGFRINSAADDAAGLQISNRLGSQINGLNQGNRNANDAISVAQTAEGALDESTNILQRMRTLAVQSSNGSNSTEDRAALQKEVSSLQQELSRIAETTTFGGNNLLDGSFGSQSFQVGANSGETINVSIGNVSATAIGSNDIQTAGTVAGVAAAGAAFTGPATTAGTIYGPNGTATVDLSGGSITDAAATINEQGTGVSAKAVTDVTLSGFDNASDGTLEIGGESFALANYGTNVDKLAEDIGKTGVNVSVEGDELRIQSEKLDGIQVLGATAGQLTATVNLADGTQAAGVANTGDLTVNARLEMSASEEFSVAGFDAADTGAATAGSTLSAVSGLDVNTFTNAQSAIGVIDSAIERIDAQRADLGAVQNRFQATIRNQSNIAENLEGAKSRIKDADFAAETAKLTQSQILQQASQTILAQANQRPQAALQLLG
ncbi:MULTISPECIES: flagellin [Gammaproteobacteria]|jgi:flagellin|uniref:flagellin n=2 Tax=Pseudomonadota TaxID=1224 RepID=UPI000C6C2A81|nr:MULTISPECIES: flagellin [Gammaproteobacteria]MAD62670.1 flagellin [Haliea sp.]MAO67487.1 flagellin [Idiomarina sp.]MBF80330.1 flagellin [Idiomarina sp.]MBP57821.1 flagellin [Idiomarina sp.]|tara:strand:+ start:3546 stop:4946 length:1401 start_codon:yes stop_codon:yes gene_type:complete